MYKQPIQTGRFAPSPSGQLHIGNLSSSLLAWLDARSVGGRLIFRMEDLDPDRSSKESEQSIALALKALGLDWDAGYPDSEYSQSQRSSKYDEVFDLLLNRDMLYPCYCSRSERLRSAPRRAPLRFGLQMPAFEPCGAA